jgi:16S rRNA (guanine527-N7)-methyltransferase
MILLGEAEATAWLSSRLDLVPRGTSERLAAFEALIRERAETQNLISRSTLANLQLRHVVDSVQLLDLAPDVEIEWLDLGSGAGFPGLMVAVFSAHRVTLVESRRLRIEFLQKAVELLHLGDRVEILGMPIERVPPRPFDVISARAFAPLPKLLELAHSFSTEKTRWVLPKGRGAQTELEQVEHAWQGDFRLVPSITDADARIIIAEGVRPRTASYRQGRRA